MIALAHRELPANTARQLRRFQTDVDAVSDYEERVRTAKQLWSKKTNSARVTFQTVRKSLIEIHNGSPLCCICGSSEATEIDHFRPQSIYPELVFVWENYVHCCRRCNNYKSGKFAIFTHSSPNEVLDVTRRSGASVIQPPKGMPVLIDPRKEDPSTFLFLVLNGTGSPGHCRYTPAYGLDAHSETRANYTIEALGLNARNLESRQSAFAGYRDKLAQYIVCKREGGSEDDLSHRREAIKTERHKAVWEEMKRWHREGWLERSPDLQPLSQSFDAAPEVLTW